MMLAGDLVGNIFNDRDFDGSVGSGEGGASNVRAYLDLNFNGAFDEGEPFGLSDANGDYRIGTDGLSAGTEVFVRVDVPQSDVSIPGLDVDLALFTNQGQLSDTANDTQVEDIVAGDFDGDGTTDLLVNQNVVFSGQRFQVFLGQQDGRFPLNPSASESVSGNVSNMIAVDLDDDNIDELLFLDRPNNAVRVFESTNGGQDFFGSFLATVPRVVDVAAGNLDDDEDIEFVTLSRDSSQNAQITVFQPNGSQYSSTVTTYDDVAFPLGFTIGDFDFDQSNDIALFTGTPDEVTFLPGAPNGTFGDPVVSTIEGADFRSDIDTISGLFGPGTAGLAIGTEQGVMVLESNNDGTFSFWETLELFVGFDSNFQDATGAVSRIVAEDFDGDGDDDLAFTSNTPNGSGSVASVQVFENFANLDGVYVEADDSFQINVLYGEDRNIPITAGEFSVPAGQETRTVRRIALAAPSQNVDQFDPEFSQLGLKYSEELVGQEIRVELSEGDLSVGQFGVLVSNSSPTISDIGDRAVFVSNAESAPSFDISDSETAADELQVAVTSSNESLIPVNSIQVSGTGTSRTITVTPAVGQIGESTITVTVTDSGGLTASDSFAYRVLADPQFSISPNGPNGSADPDPLPRTTQTPTTWQTQRSSLREIVVELPLTVGAVSPTDLVLTNLGLESNPASDVIPLTAQNLVLENGDRLTLRFAKDELPEGRYQLELLTSLTGAEPFSLVADAQNRFYTLRGDWNGDQGVDLVDLSMLVYWFSQQTPAAPEYIDLNGDGTIDDLDVDIFAQSFLNEISLPGGSASLVGSQTELAASLITLDDPRDVNGDGSRAPRDVLNIINFLSVGIQDRFDAWRRDANRDQQVSPRDALFLINRLEAGNSAASGELPSDFIRATTAPESGPTESFTIELAAEDLSEATPPRASHGPASRHRTLSLLPDEQTPVSGTGSEDSDSLDDVIEVLAMTIRDR